MKVAALRTGAVLRLFDLLAHRLRAYYARYGAGQPLSVPPRQAVELRTSLTGRSLLLPLRVVYVGK